jgi:DNA-binding MarR family transcriptional regulator
MRLIRILDLLNRDQVCCGDVTIQQCYTLCLLRQEGGKSMQQMADALGLALSTVTRNVDVLERRGAVVRERDLKDARLVHVRLTPEGRQLTEGLIASEAACCGQLLDFIPAERHESLLLALADLLQAAERCAACLLLIPWCVFNLAKSSAK